MNYREVSKIVYDCKCGHCYSRESIQDELIESQKAEILRLKDATISITAQREGLFVEKVELLKRIDVLTRLLKDINRECNWKVDGRRPAGAINRIAALARVGREKE